MPSTSGHPVSEPQHTGDDRGDGNGLLAALAWFTRLPVGARNGISPARAIAWLPAVGVVVAGSGALARLLTIGWMGDFASAVVTVAVCVVVAGAYHEDGLADSFDGLWGGWTPERRLQIMRDSRLGTYGAAALVLVLLLRVGILAPLDAPTTARVLVVGHVLGRATVLPLLLAAEPVRQDGALVAVGKPSRSAWIIGGVTVLVAVALAAGPAVGASALVVAAGVAALFARIAISRLGGLTGDVLGAANQLAHVAAMAVTATLVGTPA